MDASRALRTVTQTALLLLLIGAMAFGGGFTNRIRGGWLQVPQVFSAAHAQNATTLAQSGDAPVLTNVVSDTITRNMILRLIFVGPTCVAVILQGLARPRTYVAAFAVLLIGWLSLYVGWGTYFDMARNSTTFASARPGAFDWALRHPDPSWNFRRRWIRDAAGMALRGLVQTCVPGLVLHGLGFGPTYLLSGVAMAMAYEIGQDIPYTADPDFTQGTPLAEFIWGWYTWVMLGLTVMPEAIRSIADAADTWRLRKHMSVNAGAYAQLVDGGLDADISAPMLPHGPSHLEAHGTAPAPNPTRVHSRWSALKLAALHGSLILLEIFFMYSSIWYINTPTVDPTNQDQTLLGMFTVTVTLIIVHVTYFAMGCPVWLLAQSTGTDLRTATELSVARQGRCVRLCWAGLQSTHDPGAVGAHAQPWCIRRMFCPTCTCCFGCAKTWRNGADGLTVVRRVWTFVHAVMITGMVGLIFYGAAIP